MLFTSCSTGIAFMKLRRQTTVKQAKDGWKSRLHWNLSDAAGQKLKTVTSVNHRQYITYRMNMTHNTEILLKKLILKTFMVLPGCTFRWKWMNQLAFEGCFLPTYSFYAIVYGLEDGSTIPASCRNWDVNLIRVLNITKLSMVRVIPFSRSNTKLFITCPEGGRKTQVRICCHVLRSHWCVWWNENQV